MLIKELEDRINFIDEHDNFVGIEHPNKHHGLCQFRWWFTDDEREIGTWQPREDPRKLKDGSFVNLDKLVFNTRADIYGGELKLASISNTFDGRNELETKHYMVAVCCTDEYDCPVWLVMTNNHNSWYSLGWKTNLIPGDVKIDDDEFEQENVDGKKLEI